MNLRPFHILSGRWGGGADCYLDVGINPEDPALLGRSGVVGRANRYRLDGREIEW
jgi:hypothetical protein